MDVRTFPTKGNLILAKNSLELSKQGYELMDKKRNILIRELMDLIAEATDIQEEIDTNFTNAYRALQKANIQMGIHEIETLLGGQMHQLHPIADAIAGTLVFKAGGRHAGRIAEPELIHGLELKQIGFEGDAGAFAKEVGVPAITDEGVFGKGGLDLGNVFIPYFLKTDDVRAFFPDFLQGAGSAIMPEVFAVNGIGNAQIEGDQLNHEKIPPW